MRTLPVLALATALFGSSAAFAAPSPARAGVTGPVAVEIAIAPGALKAGPAIRGAAVKRRPGGAWVPGHADQNGVYVPGHWARI